MIQCKLINICVVKKKKKLWRRKETQEMDTSDHKVAEYIYGKEEFSVKMLRRLKIISLSKRLGSAEV